MTLKEFEKSTKEDYSGATVWVKGEIKMREGKVIDEKWWREKIARAWNARLKRSNRYLRERLEMEEEVLVEENSYV